MTEQDVFLNQAAAREAAKKAVIIFMEQFPRVSYRVVPSGIVVTSGEMSTIAEAGQNTTQFTKAADAVYMAAYDKHLQKCAAALLA